MKSSVKLIVFVMVVTMLVAVPASAGWFQDVVNKITGHQVLVPKTLIGLSKEKLEGPAAPAGTDPTQLKLDFIDNLIDQLEARVCALEKKAKIGQCYSGGGGNIGLANNKNLQGLQASGSELPTNKGRLTELKGGKGTGKSGKAVLNDNWDITDLSDVITNVNERNGPISVVVYNNKLFVAYLTKDNKIDMASCASNCLDERSWTKLGTILGRSETRSETKTGVGLLPRKINGKDGMYLAYIPTGTKTRPRVMLCRQDCEKPSSWSDSYPGSDVGTRGRQWASAVKPELLEASNKNLYIIYTGGDGRTLYSAIGPRSYGALEFETHYKIGRESSTHASTLVEGNDIFLASAGFIALRTMKPNEASALTFPGTSKTGWIVGVRNKNNVYAGNSIAKLGNSIYVPLILRSDNGDYPIFVMSCSKGEQCYNGDYTHFSWDKSSPLEIDKVNQNSDPQAINFGNRLYVLVTASDGHTYIARYTSPDYDWHANIKLAHNLMASSKPVMAEHTGKLYAAYRLGWAATKPGISLRSCEKECTNPQSWGKEKYIPVTDSNADIKPGSLSMYSYHGTLFISFIQDNKIKIISVESDDALGRKWESPKVLADSKANLLKTSLISQGKNLYLIYSARNSGLYSLSCSNHCQDPYYWSRPHKISSKMFRDIDSAVYNGRLYVAGLENNDKIYVSTCKRKTDEKCLEHLQNFELAIKSKNAAKIPYKSVAIGQAYGKLWVLVGTSDKTYELLSCHEDYCYGEFDYYLFWKNSLKKLEGSGFKDGTSSLQTFENKLYALYGTQLNDKLKTYDLRLAAYYNKKAITLN